MANKKQTRSAPEPKTNNNVTPEETPDEQQTPENGPETPDEQSDAPDATDGENGVPEAPPGPEVPTLTQTVFEVGKRPSSLDPVPRDMSVMWFSDDAYEESGDFYIVLKEPVYRRIQYPGSNKFGRSLAYPAGKRVPKSVLNDRVNYDNE